ncbi:sodium/glucose cotransporter 4-like [Gigantopelta aegis]|uniref:sodium/glucose cotransporter 4-like n=1 Tax=Gigantopelta aegis TaxID=1735272 RepID=UPI001B88B6FA|nr:sodium/glucose cotransporter 4-like [Gigantopelta aegis]
MAELHIGDLLVILGYFVLVLAVGLWSSCTTNTGSVKGYFMAGRDMWWLPIGASVFATNFGSHFFVGMSGSAAAGGLAVVIYEWHAVFILMLLGWFFIPVYVSSGAYTMPTYLKRRFGGRRLQIYLSILAIFLLIIQKISVSMYAGAVFIQQSLGWNMYVSIISVTVVTAVYTIIGGLSAVIWTDTLQTVIMLFGAIWLCAKGLIKTGGIEGLFEQYMHAVPNVTTCGNTTAGFPRADSLHIFRDPVTGDIPWPGAIFGLTPLAILAWCTDQVMVQRVLSAKTHSHAKGGVIFASWLKITPFFLVILPGMIGRTLFPNEVACVDPDICERVCGNRNGCSNIAYPKLVVEILPPGVRGLMLACMLSALMSTLTSVFNSSSSMFTLDLWTKFRKKATERELMIVGRIFILVLVAISIAWIPILMAAQGGKLWDYLQAVQAYVSPPWVVVFILGIVWKGTTEQGAFWGLMAGLAVGLTRMIMDFAYPKPACGEDETRPKVLYKVHFLYFSLILTFVVLVVCVVVSLFTQKRPEEKLRRCTWWTRYSREPREDTDDEEDFDNEAGRQEHEGQDASKHAIEDGKISIKQRVYNIVCCYSSMKPRVMTKAMEEEQALRYRGKGEKKWIKRLLDFNCIFVMAFTVFLIAFFY